MISFFKSHSASSLLILMSKNSPNLSLGISVFSNSFFDWNLIFAKTLRQKTGKKILLVVNARGGSNIKAWLPSAEEKYLDEAIRRTKEATKYGPLKGILWHQGESNSGAPQSYMKQLETMVGELRKQLDADNVPFVAGEIAPWHHNRDKFNPIIRTIKEHINNSDWVSSESCGNCIVATSASDGTVKVTYKRSKTMR
jgi:hypothetical protein